MLGFFVIKRQAITNYIDANEIAQLEYNNEKKEVTIKYKNALLNFEQFTCVESVKYFSEKDLNSLI